jgi:hypothetical protein
MKTIKKVIFTVAGICLLIACSKSDRFWGDEPFYGLKGRPAVV